MDIIIIKSDDGGAYNWGSGEHFVFGNKDWENIKTPLLNKELQRLQEVKNVTVKKIKSVRNSSLALLSTFNYDIFCYIFLKVTEAYMLGVIMNMDN